MQLRTNAPPSRDYVLKLANAADVSENTVMRFLLGMPGKPRMDRRLEQAAEQLALAGVSP